MTAVSRTIERVEVTFDDPSLVADAGLIVPATLMIRLGLETLVNRWFDSPVASVVHCLAARCSLWSHPFSPAPPTSTMPTACAQVPRIGCCRFG